MASPFRPAAPSILAALAYALAAAVWLVAGEWLPGGRWLAVHLFTLGVMTNLVLTFSEHFSRTVTRTPGERAWWWPLVTNLGIVLVLVGSAAQVRWSLTIGAVTITAAVTAAYLRLRRMRRQALGARFTWVVRVYERAHGAFIHGAVLGALLGIGVLSGPWWGAARLAHLHVNVLGWGGLTLLATLVFFGPSMARTRIVPGADARAARALRWAATGLTVAVLALLATGIGGLGGSLARWVAAGGLAIYAAMAGVVCWPVARAAWSARATAARPLVVAVCAWFPLVAAADALVVASATWRWLDTLGLAVLVGVLAQSVLTTLIYLTPMLRGGGPAGREALRLRMERGAVARAVAFNLGLALWLLGDATAVAGLATVGVGAVLATAVATLVSATWPVDRDLATAEPPVGRTTLPMVGEGTRR